MKNSKVLPIIILILILAIGFYLRVANIEGAPPGVYPDEAVNGEDALRALKTGEFEWFYTANNGREGLFINFIAFFFKFLGVSILSLKLPSIFFGTATILGVYLLAKELFQKENPALISAFLTAVSFWPLDFSRIAFRAIMLPAVLVWSTYLLWQGMRARKALPFFVGGLVFGLGLHTYIAFRIAPAILVLTLISFWMNDRSFWKRYWRQILIFILGSIFSALPMLYTFWMHPEFLESRSASISILSPEVNQGHLVQTFLKSLGLSLAKYNFWGDQNWRHNYPPYPILDPLTGLAFLVGIIGSANIFIRSSWKRLRKKLPSREMTVHVFLLSWFFIMLAPEFLTAEGLPHALRAIGTIPPIMIFSGWAISLLVERSAKLRRFKKTALGIFFLLLFTIGIFNALKYHIFWASKKKTAISFERTLMEISDYLKVLPPDKQKVIITGNMQRVPIRLFNDGLPNVSYFHPDEVRSSAIDALPFSYAIMTDNDSGITSRLLQMHPDMHLEERKDDSGLSFYVIRR